MPRISEFYGIMIYMYFSDHSPPHFHAIYGGFEAEIEIASAEVRDGHLPTRARGLVLDWARSYRGELLQNWDRAQAGQPLKPVPPLE
jgi:hypothetical protein